MGCGLVHGWVWVELSCRHVVHYIGEKGGWGKQMNREIENVQLEVMIRQL